MTAAAKLKASGLLLCTNMKSSIIPVETLGPDYDACQGDAMSATPTVKSLHAQWVAAFNTHELDRHMALYTEDAMLFGAVDELQDGRDAIRAYFGGRGPDVRVKSYPMPLVRQVSADVAITAGHVDFADGD